MALGIVQRGMQGEARGRVGASQGEQGGRLPGTQGGGGEGGVEATG